MHELADDRSVSRLRLARESQGLTREELARRAGTSTSTITRAENDRRFPKTVTMQAVAAVLNKSLDEILEPVQELSA